MSLLSSLTTTLKEQLTYEKIQPVVEKGYEHYTKVTPKRVRLVDAFLAFVMMTGVVQFVYMVLVGQYPFNSFLSGFFSTLGVFVLTVSLRLQLVSPKEFHDITEQRAFVDYIVSNIILHFVVITFMG